MREETAKASTLYEEIESLRRLTAGGLREKYLEVFGEESRSGHKQFLFRRIAWRIQANALGGLSERARQRALEIADDADLRIRAPKNFLQMPLDETRTSESRCLASADPRLPLDGSDLKRHFRGKDIVVRVREEGFEAVPFAERGRAGGNRHPLERVRLLWVGQQTGGQTWRVPAIARRK